MENRTDRDFVVVFRTVKPSGGQYARWLAGYGVAIGMSDASSLLQRLFFSSLPDETFSAHLNMFLATPIFVFRGCADRKWIIIFSYWVFGTTLFYRNPSLVGAEHSGKVASLVRLLPCEL